MDSRPEQDPRIYFAAERTLLAWIRTGLGLIGVGFAVSRFGLFLRQMNAGGMPGRVPATGISLWSGIALVALGVLVNVQALRRHIDQVRRLRSGTWVAGEISREGVALAAILAITGAAMALYLLILSA